MARKNQNGGTTMVPKEDQLPTKTADAFAELGLSPEEEALLADNDGLEDVDSTDLRIAHWIWNIGGKRKNADGDEFDLRPDQFFNTITEEVADKLRLIFIFMKKSNRWSYYDTKEERRINVCISRDRITGRMLRAKNDLREGQERSCEGCPQSQWRTFIDQQTEEERRVLDCAPEQTYVALDTDSKMACVIRFKRSSLSDARLWLNKFILNQRITAQGRRNYPLYAFEFEVTLKLSENGKFATPQFERKRVLNREELLAMQAQQKQFRQYIDRVMDTADAGDREDEATGQTNDEDASFNPNELDDEKPVDPSPPESRGRGQKGMNF